MCHERRWQTKTPGKLNIPSEMDGMETCEVTTRGGGGCCCCCWPPSPMRVKTPFFATKGCGKFSWNGHQKFDNSGNLGMYPTHGILTYFREHIQVYRSTSIRAIRRFCCISPGAGRARWHHQWPMGSDGAEYTDRFIVFLSFHMGNEKRVPGWLGYIGDYTTRTQLYRCFQK